MSGTSSSLGTTPSPTKRAWTQVSAILFHHPSSDNEEDNVNPPPSSPSPVRTVRLVFLYLIITNTVLICYSSSSLRLIHPDLPLGKRTPFPLAYACDMDAQFRKVKLLPLNLTVVQQFENVFGHLGIKFNCSTYSNSWKAWECAPADVITKAIACQHNPGGEWGPIVTAYRQA
ncbi:hypothetical protein B0H10DRAFT_1965485 [Mycena sp. CBHHK59/15]|nr:hypothetical protein B0H10DRAFT_1965485 [Mycena sp. CBHHK59/15]